MDAEQQALTAKFHAEMVETYYLLKERYGYPANYFLGMVEEHGGVDAAHRLLASREPAEGLTRLWELKRLDLSVEAAVLKPEYGPLFSDEERRIARRRLQDYGWKGQA